VSRYPRSWQRFNDRNIVRSEACSTPISSKDAQRVRLGRRLDDPGQDHLLERVITHRVKPQLAVPAGEDLPQQRAPLAGDHPTPDRARWQRQLQLALARVHSCPRDLEQGDQLRRRACRAHVLNHVVAVPNSLGDLHRCGPRGGRDLPHKHHDHRPYRPD
jgi:hypothetical protein